jgi:IAA-amino acid hydrolase
MINKTMPNILERSNAIQEEIRTWRRTIHRYPELGFTEQRTGQLIQKALKNLKIPFKANVAKTGIIAEIKGGNGPTVGLRADMDALPIQEENGFDFDSTRPGIMHACGHDAHTSMLLGAATVLKGLSSEGQLPGTIRLLFQPSEEGWDSEGKSGGKRMVEEGLLKGLDAVFGLHVEPHLEVGQLSTRAGPMLASVDDFTLVITGQGGHAAAPHLTQDIIALSSLVINAIHHIASRRIDPVEHGLITVATIHAGHASNVIDTHIKITGTIRSMKPEIRKQLHKELTKACSIVKPFDANVDLKIGTGYPATVNDAQATGVAVQATEAIFGKKNVKEAPLQMGAEDFSYMAQAAPGCFMLLGVKNRKWKQSYSVHTPTFRMDEDALPLGTASLCAAALQWMQAPGLTLR